MRLKPLTKMVTCMDRAKEIALASQKYLAVMKTPHSELAKGFMQQCEPEAIRLKNKQYNYYRCGDGPTVVLIHGLHSNLGSQLGELTAIVAHSLGGLWAVSSWGEQFQAKTLILISTPSNNRFLVEQFIARNNIDEELADGLVQQIERRFGTSYWTDFSPRDTINSVGVPGLIIHSRNDQFVPSSHAEQIHSNWNAANIEILDGDEHLNMAESPQVRKLITEQINRVS